MITKAEADAIKRAVRRLVRAAVDDSWKGGGDPLFIPDIEHEYRSAKAKFASLMSPKTQKPKLPAGVTEAK